MSSKNRLETLKVIANLQIRLTCRYNPCYNQAMPYQDQKSIAFPGDVQKRIMTVARENNLPAYRLIDQAIATWLEARRRGITFAPVNGDEAQE